MKIDFNKLDKILNIDLNQKIEEYFDGKLWAGNPQGIKEQNKRAKELLSIAKDCDELALGGEFLEIWNIFYKIEEEDWNDLQIEKVFYYR